MSESPDQSRFTARLEQVRPLHELAHAWYVLSVTCRCMGALTERVIKEILYESTNNSGQPSVGESDMSVNESANGNPN